MLPSWSWLLPGSVLAGAIASCGARTPLAVPQDDLRSCPAPPALEPPACSDAGGALEVRIAARLGDATDHKEICTDPGGAGWSDAALDVHPDPTVDVVTFGAGRAFLFEYEFAGAASSALTTAIVGYDSADPLEVDWYCAGAGSTITTLPPSGEGTELAQLTALRELGTCAEAAASPGSVELDATGGTELRLDGSTTHWADNFGGEVGELEDARSLKAPFPGGLLVLWFDDAMNLVAGLLEFNQAGPDPGAVYCVTSGKSWLVADGLGVAFSVGGLRRLGRCDEAKALGPCAGMTVAWGPKT